MEVKPGDRVRHIGQMSKVFGDGTVIEKCGKKSVWVKWDNSNAIGRPTIKSLEVIK